MPDGVSVMVSAAENTEPEDVAKPLPVLCKEEILGAENPEPVPVHVPEFGGAVMVRVMSGTERDKLESRYAGKKAAQLVGFKTDLLCLCVCNPDGSAMFDPETIGALMEKASTAINTLVDAALALNGLSEEEAQELVKN